MLTVCNISYSNKLPDNPNKLTRFCSFVSLNRSMSDVCNASTMLHHELTDKI